MTEREFYLCLKPRYGGQDFALIPQVRNQTGYSRRVRTADAIAVGLWPSRGIDVHGFEFKDSRTDWLKELKDGSKAEEIGRFCAYWWLVVSDPKIFSPDELPAAWGAIHAKDGATVILKKAPRRETQEPSWVFVASILRAAQEVVTSEAEVQRQVAAAVSKANDGNYAAISKARNEGRADGQKAAEEMAAKVREFEKASGIRIDGWSYSEDAQKVGETVRFLLSGGADGLEGRLRGVVEAAKRIASEAEKALALPGVRRAA